jgi:hypothetical protein
VFHRRTNGAFSAAFPQISDPRPGNYGAAGAHQHDRLDQAAKLNRVAALESASWGRFQLMGFNWKTCGFASLQEFVNAMYRSEGAQLDAFVQFLLRDPATYKVDGPLKGMRMVDAIRARQWAAFACLYNGPNYRANDYDTHLRAFYDAAPVTEKRVPDVHDLVGASK